MSGEGDPDQRGQRRGLTTPLDVRGFAARLASPTAGALLVVAIVGVLVAGISAASLQRRDPVFESSQLLLIDQPGALALAPSGDLVAKLATLRVKYVSLLLSEAVLDPAAEELGLPVGEVGAAVRASAPPESLLIRITARTATAEPAPRIAQAMGASLSRYLDQEQAALAVPEANRITLTPLRSPPAATQVEPSARRSLGAGIVGGIVAAGIVYLVLGLLPIGRRWEPSEP